MISVAEARTIMLAHTPRKSAEIVALEAALGRTLAAPVVAARPQPPFRASAMDGYAVHASDTPGRLLLVGEAGAGHALDRRLAAGECARIFTGAPLPDGADAVVIQEDVTRDGERVAVPSISIGKHVRAAGVDFTAGATLLDHGAVLDGADLAIAAAAGCPALTVAQRPRVTVLGGGDEIVAPGSPIKADQIFDCASFGVSGLAQSWGAASERGPIMPDNAKLMASEIETALSKSDLVVVIGGASVGDHDHARAAVEALDARILFDRVSLRPGKPTWFALCADRAILGLPGNPGSALVTARLFLRPIIVAMLGGDAAQSVRPQRARLAAPLAANGPREAYLRAKIDVDDEARLWVTPANSQDSSLVSGFSCADALIIHEANSAALARGALVPTLRI